MRKRVEANLEKDILQWLDYNGIAAFKNEIPQGIPCMKSPTHRRRTPNRSSADIIGVQNGRAIFIEVKRPDMQKMVMNIYNDLKNVGYCNKYTYNDTTMHIMEQANFLLWTAKHGAISFFAFSLEDVICELKERQKEWVFTGNHD